MAGMIDLAPGTNSSIRPAMNHEKMRTSLRDLEESNN